MSLAMHLHLAPKARWAAPVPCARIATGACAALAFRRDMRSGLEKKACARISTVEKRFARARACVMLRAASRDLYSMAREHGFKPRGDSAMAKKGGAPTKSEILAQIAKDVELSRKQVSEMFESLNGIIKKSLRGNGLFTLPGLLKLKVVKKPATKAREGVNPFTGEKMTFKAKPASKKVRALPLKNLKNFVN
jgi:nucleoid DNA-binding protein